MTEPRRSEPPPEIRPDLPHGARIWNYWLGGTDNYPADRAVGDAVRAAWPDVVDGAVRSRQFLARVVRMLAADLGVRQFLDVGTGLPTMQNTHEVAQAIAPQARIVYVDNDPLVLAQARKLLADNSSEGMADYLHGDYREPEKIIDGARDVLDFEQPIAVMFMALWDGTDTSERARAGARAQAEMGSPYHQRTVAEIERWFDGLEMVEPGLVSITQWRPDQAEVEAIDGYGALARKP